MYKDRLLAKTVQKFPTESNSFFLEIHLEDVHDCGKRILESTLGEQLIASGLDAIHASRLKSIVLAAAATHDLGKANNHFQDMITGTRNIRVNPQGLRHEWVSVLILQQLEPWLSQLFEPFPDDYQVLQWVVAGHHPGINHPSPPETVPDGAGTELNVLYEHPGFRKCLDKVSHLLGLQPCTLALKQQSVALTGGNSVFEQIHDWSIKARVLWNKVRKTPLAKITALAKANLMAADVAGSAIPTAIKTSDKFNWITVALKDKPIAGELEEIANLRLGGNKPRDFQNEVASSKARATLVNAGCGSGKTLAAYLWAAKNHAGRRLYFCYPTTGTATEGFRDYLFDEAECLPRFGARLFHGRSDIDFELILNAGNDLVDNSDLDLRLCSLKAWKTPVVSCTVDTVLGLIQNNRKGLYAWPALAQSAFVFDEIHSFDERLFGALLLFIKTMPGVPLLLMTASLPAFRLDVLKEALRTIGQRLEIVKGPTEIESIPRYHRITNEIIDPVGILEEAFEGKKKVLWVTNTVQRAMDVEKAHKKFNPIVYHSRFKYMDRVERHAALIGAFRNNDFAFSVCTQVAEMSLDISADVLISDIAPIPSLIQRLGRLNRRAKYGCSTMPFVIHEVEQPLPYSEEDLGESRKWLENLKSHPGISQANLVEAWETGQAQGRENPYIHGAWLDGGPVTAIAGLRETSPGISILMEEDLDSLVHGKSGIQRYVIPMPPNKESSSWERFKGITVAPRGHVSYDRLRGAEWQ